MLSYHEWMLFVKQFTQHIKVINELLHADKLSFTKNNYDAIQKSNDQKKQTFSQLQQMISEFTQKMNPNNQGFIDILQDQINLSEKTKKMSMQDSLDQLKIQIQQGIQHLSVNSKVISTNLENLKLLWDQLLNTRKDSIKLYGKSGLIDK